jgi:hypothetical protein
MDALLTMLAKAKTLTATKMMTMTKKIPGTCQGVYRAMGTVVVFVFVSGWLLLHHSLYTGVLRLQKRRKKDACIGPCNSLIMTMIIDLTQDTFS